MTKRIEATFQSTLPVWGATGVRQNCRVQGENFNPRSPCGERLGEIDEVLRSIAISIHAPRVGSDTVAQSLTDAVNHFNPRSPCGERPSAIRRGTTAALIFQSTLPVWGATNLLVCLSPHGLYFNPRSPCGERPHVTTSQ